MTDMPMRGLSPRMSQPVITKQAQCKKPLVVADPFDCSWAGLNDRKELEILVFTYDCICTHLVVFEGDLQVKIYLGNWSDYETMTQEKFGKDLTPHWVNMER
ncbi:MAG TPA: hypothetical protein VLT51_02315 [Anaerolineales bacterium]|nr:hypothetical protein [Anaerolineales bacterium]